ncbi:hypothetical protein ABZ532_08590 [Streptomyces sp. NPDC019396]|uniref:hypothetical protein n=1 Tax=Streptomyces sp. NPDC019396 TaxID=3154687 RepID=UPI0033EBEFD2
MPRDVSETRDALRVTLNECESWLESAVTAPDASEAWLQGLREDADAVRRLRTRAASALINVALLGYFSSGKSFLLSGLQGGLELVEAITETGETGEKFVGLLPSSPVPTTSWPFSVVPVDPQSGVDASGTGFLRVRFADAPPDEWENVGNSPAPAVVEAYAMEQGDVVNRLRPHRGREVAEAELLLAEALLPAKFYDLPGVGSSNTTHDRIVRRALLDADCYLYVTPAGRTLSETDLSLIRVLYDHCLLSGQNSQRKRVVWVVTAIDTASHLDLRNQPEWKATVARNNQYLRDNFKLPDGRPDLEFIGEGFIAVSPAWEASAAKLDAEGAEAAAHRQRNKSNMDELRGAIEDLISTGTGTRHISAMAAEARYLIGQRHRVLEQRLQTERLEIDELKERLDLQRRRVELLDTALPAVREELGRKLLDRVDRAARPFNRLAGHLHSVLDSVIRGADLNKLTQANQIQVSKAQALRAWLESPSGPVTLWNQEYEAFKQDVVRTVDRVFGDRELASRLPEFAFDVNDVSAPGRTRRRATTHDVVQRAAALVGIVTPVVASGGWVYGLAAAGTLLPPAGLVAGVAGLVYLGIQIRKGRASSLDVLREEWIQAVDAEATAVRQQFTLAISVQATEVVDHLTDNLDRYREHLEESSDFIRERIAQPENRARQEVVDQLEPLCTGGRELVAALRALETPDTRP